MQCWCLQATGVIKDVPVRVPGKTFVFKVMGVNWGIEFSVPAIKLEITSCLPVHALKTSLVCLYVVSAGNRGSLIYLQLFLDFLAQN